MTLLAETCNLLLAEYCYAINMVLFDRNFIKEYSSFHRLYYVYS
jgi:hypothetical protein